MDLYFSRVLLGGNILFNHVITQTAYLPMHYVTVTGGFQEQATPQNSDRKHVNSRYDDT